MKIKKLTIKVVPNAKIEGIIEEEPLVLKVKAPPEKGKANRAVMKLLKKKFHAKTVKIISGKKSRRKVVEISVEE